MNDFTIGEKMFLQKAIFYLKFRSMDDEDKPRELAGSSFANSIFDKIYEDLKNEYQKHGIEYQKHPPFNKENDMPSIMNYMKNIGEINWLKFEDNHKRNIIQGRLYPLSHNDELVDEILTMTEAHYKENNQ